MKKISDYILFSKGLSWPNFFKNLVKVALFWSPVVSLLFTLGFGGLEDFYRRFCVSLSIAVTCAVFCMVGSHIIDEAYEFYRVKKNYSRASHSPLWGVLVSYIFMVPGLYFGFKVSAYVHGYFGRQTSGPDLQDYTSGMIFGLLVSGLFLVFEVLRELKTAKHEAAIKLQQLENEKLKAQVSALSAQMNPHLLFNALNTIASTISSDPDSAEDMVVQLSELYRGILKSAKGDAHSLATEIRLCKAYLEIEQKRFGERVKFYIEVDNHVDAERIQIPVLLLQPLVENAVKHGLSPLKNGGTIQIKVFKKNENLVMQITDSGVGPKNSTDSSGTGTGLLNAKQRVLLKYGDKSGFFFGRNEQNETEAAISIPIEDLTRD